MKKYIQFFFLSALPVFGIGQTIISNNNTSVLLTPDGIQIKPDSNYNDTNTGIGKNALQKNTKDNNTAIGIGTLQNNISGENNTAIGAYALLLNQSGKDNVAIGTNTLSFNTGNGHTVVGHNAAISLSEFNAFGTSAFGYEALYSNQSTASTAFGYKALKSNTYGSANTAVGFQALKTGNGLSHNYNTAVGYFALTKNEAENNTALGADALEQNSTGHDNLAIGVSSLAANTEGQRNIGIGNESLFSTTTNYGNIAIGHGAGHDNSQSLKLYIENSINTSYYERPLIGGNFLDDGSEIHRKVGINRNMTDLMNTSETFQVEGNAYKSLCCGNWNSPSDRRLKKNINELNSAQMLEKILSLQGVDFEWKDQNKGQGIQHGFIAQELRQIFPTKVQEDKNGYLSASYGDFDPFLVEAIKALHEELQIVKDELSSIKVQLTNIGKLNLKNQ